MAIYTNKVLDSDSYQKRTEDTASRELPIDTETTNLSRSYLGMIRLHWHEDVEFDFVLSGSAYFTCGSENYLLHPGDVIFINKNVKHSLTPESDDDCIFFRLNFQPARLMGFGMLELTQKYIYPLLSNPDCKSIAFTGNDELHQTIQAHLDAIMNLANNKPFCYELDIKSHIFSMWSILCKLYVDHASNDLPSQASNQDEYRIKQALLYIHEHYAEQITLDDIANSIMVSKSECCRCFKRCLNIRPFEYLMQYRITESTKQMYYHSNASISDIAISVGFNNTSYYNKIFKKYMDTTPTEYRKKLKKDIPT